MKVKTAYRRKAQAEIPQPDRPVAAAPNIEPQPEPEIKSEAELKSDAPPIEQKSEAEYAEETAKADAAARDLKRQLADLARAEQLNRQAVQAPRAPSRDDLLQQWRQHGLSADDEAFLKEHPQLIDGWELTRYAANEAAKEHQRGTAQHREATLKVFDETMARLQAQAAANNSAQQRTPEFFQAPPPQPRPAPKSASSIVSAPVSRNGGPSGDYGSDLPRDAKQVRLRRERRRDRRANRVINSLQPIADHGHPADTDDRNQSSYQAVLDNGCAGLVSKEACGDIEYHHASSCAGAVWPMRPRFCVQRIMEGPPYVKIKARPQFFAASYLMAFDGLIGRLIRRKVG